MILLLGVVFLFGYNTVFNRFSLLTVWGHYCFTIISTILLLGISFISCSAFICFIFVIIMLHNFELQVTNAITENVYFVN